MKLDKDTQSWEYVIADMWKRNQEGFEKYNRYLQADCPDNMLQHLYEELLDAAVYIKTLINQKALAKSEEA